MSNSDEIVLEWQGPYGWFGEGATSIFSRASAKTGGVYAWTVPVGNSYRVFYVGQTGVGLAARHHDHFRDYFGGAYSIYAPDAFAAGRLDLLYKGYAYRSPRWLRALPFHERFMELMDPLLANLRSMLIWMAQLDQPQRILRRVETALMQVLYERGHEANQLLQPGLRLEPRRENESPISVFQRPVGLLEGLPENFIA